MPSTPRFQDLPPWILRDVCDALLTHCHGFEERRSGVQSVIYLLRSCHALHEAAADALWNTLPGIAPLIYTMPPDAWKVEKLEEFGGYFKNETLSFSRPLLEADFTRFNHYAPRVRKLVPLFGREDYPTKLWSTRAFVSPSVLETLQRHLSDAPGPLLPYLQVLRTDSVSTDSDASLRPLVDVFLCSTIRELELYFKVQSFEMEDEFEQVLTKAKTVSPYIQSLQVQYHGMTNTLYSSRALSEALPSFQYLTNYTADNLTLSADALIHLATLPHLRSLTIPVLSEAVAALCYPGHPQDLFPSLRDLTIIDIRSFADCQAILDLVSSHSLQFLQFAAGREADWPAPGRTNRLVQGAAQLLRALGAREGKQAIQAIHLTGGDDCSQDVNAMAFTGAMLEPLFALPNLEELTLDVNCDFALEERTIESIAHAWPHLSYLVLGSVEHDRVGPEPGVPLSCLATLARGCPELRHLRIGVDATSVPEDMHNKWPRTSSSISHSKTKLRVGWSAIGDSVAVASFLSGVFPSIVDVSSAWPMEGDFFGLPEHYTEEFSLPHDRWCEVAGLLPRFALVRQQERHRSQPDTNGSAI